MLMKWARVDKDGSFTVTGNPAISYSTLIPERLSVCEGFVRMAGQALTIACRYSCARKQGPHDEKIMDFQTHYAQLLPSVAYTYMIKVVERVLMARWDNMAKLLHTSQDAFVKLLPDMHAISAGLKASATWRGSEILETCRRACGGHAYSAYNAIAGIIGDWGVMTTGTRDFSLPSINTFMHTQGAETTFH
jgi:acyl-CoA oxidase